ncbi:MAG: hypothetical protein NTW95_10580 [Candidatus Aminicenantes bacterium]|nr:hypothetical protein [Candidatus Aminicenantes bacterium]
MSDAKKRLICGFAAIVFYMAHAATWLLRGAPANLLWTCHLGCLLAGIAILADIPLLNAVSIHWLVLGNILWTINLAGGGEFICTSQLTHLGGLLIALWYARRAGFPRGSWMKALAGIAALHVLSGFVTPARENINLAFRVFEGWEKIFPDFQFYRLFLLAVSAALFYAVERGAHRLLVRPRPTGRPTVS